MPRLIDRKTASLLLCGFAMIPTLLLYGQNKPQVAPPDKSDSYATDEDGRRSRTQHREIAATNFQIAGVDLAAKGDFFEQTFRVLGKVPTVSSGDGVNASDEACYRSADANDDTHLIFGQGEVDQSFILSSDNSAWKWKTPCKRSQGITRSLATVSGLHLGQSQEQVVAILGLPTSRSKSVKNGRDHLKYSLEARKKTDPQQYARALKQELQKNPKLDKNVFEENWRFYYLEVYIDATFIHDALTNLEISWSAQY